MKLYACCDDPACPYCFGSGLVSGPEADAFYSSLETLLEKRMLQAEEAEAVGVALIKLESINPENLMRAGQYSVVENIDALRKIAEPKTLRWSSDNPGMQSLPKQPGQEPAEASLDSPPNESDIPF